jgi:enoyl-CoA hydratase
VNAVTNDFLTELSDVLTALQEREDISCVLFGSALEKAFSAGADLKQLGEKLGDARHGERRQFLVRKVFDQIMDFPFPVIAVVDGPALGSGCVIAAVCDLRVASRRATFGLPEINVGRCGGGRHLMRLVPQGKLRQMYFTGRPLLAEEGYQAGLVDILTEDGEVWDRAYELAEEIASKSPVALRYAKTSLNYCEEMGVKQGYMFEQQFTTKLSKTEDAKEASAAWLEKRTPVWKGY